MPAYRIQRARRGARSIRITIRPGGEVVVSVPCGVPQEVAEAFVEKKSAWVEAHVAHARHALRLPARSPAHFRAYAPAARVLVAEKLSTWNRLYGCTWQRVRIANQKTRWGSCTRAGTISIHYRILFLPEHLQDYLIVHELCHLREHNHSPRFWALVARACPEWQRARKELRRYV